MASKDLLTQLEHLLRPLRNSVRNMVARGVVQLVNDGLKLQKLQLGALANQDVDNSEHFQPYGFSSVPIEGAEHLTLFPSGDGGHPITLAVTDRRYRPTGGKSGEVCMYTDEGDVIRLGRGHIVSLETSGEVRLGSATASEGAIKGDQRNTAEQTFLTALNTYIVAIKPVADPTNVGTSTLSTAIGVFKTAVAAAVSTKVKVE